MKQRLSVLIVSLMIFSLCIPGIFIYGGTSDLVDMRNVVLALNEDDTGSTNTDGTGTNPSITPPPNGMPPPPGGMNPPNGDGQGGPKKPGGPGGSDIQGGQDSQGGQNGLKNSDVTSLENGIIKLREDIKQARAAIIGFEAKKLDLSTGGKMAVYQKELFEKQKLDLDTWYKAKKAELTAEKDLAALKTVYTMEKKSIENRMKKLETDLKRKPPEGNSEKILKQLEKNISQAKKDLEKKTAQLQKLLAQLKKVAPDSKVLTDPSDEESEALPDETP